jgi:ferrous iron transport protein A
VPPDMLSISRGLCNKDVKPNANPSHLHSSRRNLILAAVKTIENAAASAPAIPLAQLQRGEAGLVTGLLSVGGLRRDDNDSMLARLRDLGFVSGARCDVLARMWPSGDPLAVRIGGSTFALRRAEAEAVQVTRLVQEDAARDPLARNDPSAVAA